MPLNVRAPKCLSDEARSVLRVFNPRCLRSRGSCATFRRIGCKVSVDHDVGTAIRNQKRTGHAIPPCSYVEPASAEKGELHVRNIVGRVCFRCGQSRLFPDSAVGRVIFDQLKLSPGQILPFKNLPNAFRFLAKSRSCGIGMTKNGRECGGSPSTCSSLSPKGEGDESLKGSRERNSERPRRTRIKFPPWMAS